VSTATVEPILVPREHVNDDSVFVTEWAVAEGTASRPERSSAASRPRRRSSRSRRRRRLVRQREGGRRGPDRRRARLRQRRGRHRSSGRAAITHGGRRAQQISAKARRKIEGSGSTRALRRQDNVREKDVVGWRPRWPPRPAAPPGSARPVAFEALGPVQRRTARVMERMASIPASTSSAAST
jgi:hypothetical protein